MKEVRIGDEIFSATHPQFVHDVQRASESIDVTETVNIAAAGYVKDAAGSTVVFDLKKAPILDFGGGYVGSFWGFKQNLHYTSQSQNNKAVAKLQTVTETNGSAAFTIDEPSVDLEKIFESATRGRYIAKVYDKSGRSLYGWIGGITVSGSVYTVTVYNSRALSTQNWFQGGSTAFDNTQPDYVEIYRNSTSLAFSSTDTFTEEVPYHEPGKNQDFGHTEFKLLASLAEGQYAVDYRRGRVFARKLNADDTEIATYKIRANTSSDTTQAKTVGDFLKVVAATAVPEAVSASSLVVSAVDIQADFNNTTNVAVGASTVNLSGTVGLSRGVVLVPGASVRLYNVDLANVYVDVGTNGDAVHGMYTI